MRGAQLPPQAGRALCPVTPAMAAGERHPHGAEPVSSQTGDDGWSPMQAGEGWRPPGKAGRTHTEGREAGAQARAPRETSARPHPTRAPPATWPRHPGHPSSIRPRPRQVALHLARPWGSRPGNAPQRVAQPVPTCTLPSAKPGEEGTPDWLLAAAGLGSWDQAPKRHLRPQWGHCSAHRHAGPQPEASNPHPPSLPKSDST